VRWAPALQAPNPPFRPASGSLEAGIVDDSSANETWAADGSGADDNGFYGDAPYRRPAPFLFTSAPGAAARAQARSLADALFFDGVQQSVLDGLAAQVQTATQGSASYNVALLQAPVAQYAANASGPIGNLARVAEAIALLPLRLALGSSQAQQRGGMQTDAAFEARPLMLLQRACAPQNETQRNELNGISQLLRAGSLACVAMPGVQLDSAADINARLFAGYGETASGTPIAAFPFALDFGATNATLGSAAAAMSATLWFNGTLVKQDGSPVNAVFRVSGALNRLALAFIDTAAPGSTPGPRATMRYVRDMPTQGLVLRIDAGSFLGPLFYTWLSQMLLPVIVGLLVYEKEHNLRTMMKMQGLGDSAYMLVNYLYYWLLYFAFMLLIYFYGWVLGTATNSLSMWTRSQPGVVIIFFILFINVQIATAFLFQAVFSSAKTATIGSVLYLLIAGLLGKFLFEAFLEAVPSGGFSQNGIVGMQLLVPFSLYRGFYEMAALGAVASYSPPGLGEQSVGISWAKVAGSRGMDVVMVIFFVEWIVLGLAGYYLDQVYATGSGVKRRPLFFLDCLLKRTLRETQAVETPQQRDSATTAVCGGRIPTFRLSGRASAAAEHEMVDMRADAPDVQACAAAAYATPPESVAILARGLAKTYPGVDGAPPKVACRELSVAIPAGECFGLLGPNGAGKSTAINLLIGFLTPSGGEAFIQGCSLQSDLDAAYSQLGVCPQHDLLWEQLTGREHLQFYGRLKNLSGAALTAACDEALRSVNLFTGGVGDRPCGTYSGGMKRRLSVAISLIGDPPVVFLVRCAVRFATPHARAQQLTRAPPG
jgi:ABC-type multidrug transport system fused ATPase/permease subunit